MHLLVALRNDAKHSSFTRDAGVQESWVSLCNPEKIFQHNFPYQDREEGCRRGSKKKSKMNVTCFLSNFAVKCSQIAISKAVPPLSV